MSWSVFKLAWAKNGTPETLSGSGDTQSISDLTAMKFIVFLAHHLQVTNSINTNIRFDGVTNTDYARRRSRNGGTDATETSQTSSNGGNGDSSDHFNIVYTINISSEEKLFICHGAEANTAGAANAPNRNEFIGKMDTSTNSGQFTQFDFINSGSGDYNTNSNLSAIGTD